ncbi:MAG: HEAT repeat domain-containing protein [Deltaproteobacteria bacterium]|nr:HEAT repeat domain-containing protein [Deltaproteobacteria bacterium]
MTLTMVPSSTAGTDLAIHSFSTSQGRQPRQRVWDSAHYLILRGDSEEDLTVVRTSIASEANTTAQSERLEEIDIFSQERIGNITAQEEPVGGILKVLFREVGSMTFKDGMESDFSRELIRLVRQYGKTAMEVITSLIVNDNVNAEVAAETLRWLGRVDHPTSHYDRLWLLERSLFSTSVLVRDGAALGLASLDDPHAIPYLRQAIDREKYASLREDLEQVHCQLEGTRSAASPAEYP